MAQGKQEVKSEDEVIGFFDEAEYDGIKKSPAKSVEKKKFSDKTESIYQKLKEIAKSNQEKSGDNDEDEGSLNLQELMQSTSALPAIRKEDVFQDALNDEEQEILRERVAKQQQMAQEFERRHLMKRAAKILRVHPYLTLDEIRETLHECRDDEEEACVFLTDYFNLQNIRKKVAIAHQKENEKNNVVEDMDEEAVFIIRKRRRTAPEKNRKSKDGKTYIYRKLRLDDALAQGNFEGWSEARIKAYKLRDKNPNAYYYRFNDPGEKQKNGPWTKEEITLFHRRLKELGANGQWGIFSMTIPGRVGYQCSNFYRQLIESGEIKDPNYYLDDKGKAHYIHKRGGGKRIPVEGEMKGEAIKKKKKIRRRKANDEDDDDDDAEYHPHAKRRFAEEEEEEEKGNNIENPLPGFIDPITLEEVNKPAISPHGHVMDYTSWSRTLTQEPRNTCPFTKKPLNKRDLVILTWDNIGEYFDKIVNLPKDYTGAQAQ